MIPRLVVTSGEPAGIGPDILLAAAAKPQPAQLVGLGDKALLTARAQQLALDVTLVPIPALPRHRPTRLASCLLLTCRWRTGSQPGTLDPRNASQVLAQLDLAVELCRSGECQGMVTAQCKRASSTTREFLLAAIRNTLRSLSCPMTW